MSFVYPLTFCIIILTVWLWPAQVYSVVVDDDDDILVQDLIIDNGNCSM
jgi:hypothetical protein